MPLLFVALAVGANITADTGDVAMDDVAGDDIAGDDIAGDDIDCVGVSAVCRSAFEEGSDSAPFVELAAFCAEFLRLAGIGTPHRIYWIGGIVVRRLPGKSRSLSTDCSFSTYCKDKAALCRITQWGAKRLAVPVK